MGMVSTLGITDINDYAMLFSSGENWKGYSGPIDFSTEKWWIKNDIPEINLLILVKKSYVVISFGLLIFF